MWTCFCVFVARTSLVVWNYHSYSKPSVNSDFIRNLLLNCPFSLWSLAILFTVCPIQLNAIVSEQLTVNKSSTIQTVGESKWSERSNLPESYRALLEIQPFANCNSGKLEVLLTSRIIPAHCVYLLWKKIICTLLKLFRFQQGAFRRLFGRLEASGFCELASRWCKQWANTVDSSQWELLIRSERLS